MKKKAYNTPEIAVVKIQSRGLLMASQTLNVVEGEYNEDFD